MSIVTFYIGKRYHYCVSVFLQAAVAVGRLVVNSAEFLLRATSPKSRCRLSRIISNVGFASFLPTDYKYLQAFDPKIKRIRALDF